MPITKDEALRKLREVTSDHFTSPGVNPGARTESIRWWIRKCQELGATEREINEVLDSEIRKYLPNPT